MLPGEIICSCVIDRRVAVKGVQDDDSNQNNFHK
jgi:hypothetical protein